MQLPITDHRAATMTAELIWINASPSELDIRIVEFFRSKSKGDTVTKTIYGLCLLSSILILSAAVPERVALAQSDSATSESTSEKTPDEREERKEDLVVRETQPGERLEALSSELRWVR